MVIRRATLSDSDGASHVPGIFSGPRFSSHAVVTSLLLAQVVLFTVQYVQSRDAIYLSVNCLKSNESSLLFLIIFLLFILQDTDALGVRILR